LAELILLISNFVRDAIPFHFSTELSETILADETYATLAKISPEGQAISKTLIKK